MNSTYWIADFYKSIFIINNYFMIKKIILIFVFFLFSLLNCSALYYVDVSNVIIEYWEDYVTPTWISYTIDNYIWSSQGNFQKKWNYIYYVWSDLNIYRYDINSSSHIMIYDTPVSQDQKIFIIWDNIYISYINRWWDIIDIYWNYIWVSWWWWFDNRVWIYVYDSFVYYRDYSSINIYGNSSLLSSNWYTTTTMYAPTDWSNQFIWYNDSWDHQYYKWTNSSIDNVTSILSSEGNTIIVDGLRYYPVTNSSYEWEQGNCYDVLIWQWFTWSTTQETLFSWIWAWIDDYTLTFASGTHNSFLLSHNTWSEKYSYTFISMWEYDAEYYYNWELCDNNTCRKNSLFWWTYWDYIHIQKPSLFSSTEVRPWMYVNTNSDNLIWFSITTLLDNYTYYLYGRSEWETGYTYLWLYTTYTRYWWWWSTFVQNKNIKFYSDFYVSINIPIYSWGTDINYVTILYWSEWGNIYDRVCEYNDWYTINWTWATLEDVQNTLNKNQESKKNIFSSGSNVSDSDISDQIWNIDVNGDWEISVWEQMIAPYTIAKNVMGKFIDTINNIWNLLKSIQNIGNIIIPHASANSASWMLDDVFWKTKDMMSGDSDRPGINRLFDVAQWWIFAITFIIIILTFLLLKIKK